MRGWGRETKEEREGVREGGEMGETERDGEGKREGEEMVRKEKI